MSEKCTLILIITIIGRQKKIKIKIKKIKKTIHPNNLRL
jgi:hypothetical protein